MSKKIICFLLIFLALGSIGICCFFFIIKPIKLEGITYEVQEKNIIAHLKFGKFTKKGTCQLGSDTIPIENNSCVVIVPNKEEKIKVITKWNEIEVAINPKVDEVIDFELSETFLYLAVGEKKAINLSIEKLGNPNIAGVFTSADETIVKAENNVLTGIGKGTTKIEVKVGNIKKEIEAVVTDLITPPTLTPKKTYLKCGIYSEEDNQLLDKILEYKINNAGYKTRAGVVTALRFLTLEFPYQLNYFFESGRLNNNTGGNYVDGEGRFYHKGLYLNQSKYKELVKTKYGPATWGCPLTNWQEEAGFIPGVRYPNGLDCSGFITWAMFNGGFDPSDTGAGDNPWTDDDLSDLGPHVEITRELLESGTLKSGDIIATDGHIAMIGGLKDNVVYVAESTTYWHGVVMHPYTFDELLNTDKLTYIIHMDDYYQEEGNYSNYWE